MTPQVEQEIQRATDHALRLACVGLLITGALSVVIPALVVLLLWVLG